MGLLDVLGGVASAVVSTLPGGKLALAAVNAFLPDGKQLPGTATSGDLRAAHDALPPDVQAQMQAKFIDLQIAEVEGWTSRFGSMNQADISGHSTRPKIAWQMCQVLSFEILAFTVWFFVYPDKASGSNLWMAFGVLTATPAGLLGKYFGELRKEQANRLEVARSPVADIITGAAKKLFRHDK